jgi:hypothetical protein
LLFATEELQPKELTKELERHLARLEKEIEGRSRTCKNPRTGQPTRIPGRVTQDKQRIVDQTSWEIHHGMKQQQKLQKKPRLRKNKLKKWPSN